MWFMPEIFRKEASSVAGISSKKGDANRARATFSTMRSHTAATRPDAETPSTSHNVVRSAGDSPFSVVASTVTSSSQSHKRAARHSRQSSSFAGSSVSIFISLHSRFACATVSRRKNWMIGWKAIEKHQCGNAQTKPNSKLDQSSNSKRGSPS